MIKDIIDRQYQSALEIIINNSSLFETWAEKLLKEEVIEVHSLKEVLMQIVRNSIIE